MASPTTPILGLTLMTTSQAQKEVVFNQLAIAFDALFKGSVLDSQLTTPPTTPNMGDAYIIPASAGGAWNGKDHHVTFYYNGWQFVEPSLKLRLYSVAQSEYLVYESNGTWTAEPSSTVSVLNDLTNVSGAAANGQVLQFSTTDNKWHPWTIAFPPLALTGLSDVQLTESGAIAGMALCWNSGDLKWEPQAVLHAPPPFMSLPDVNNAGVQEGYLAAYTAEPAGIHFVKPSSIITVSSLGQVGDVAYPTGGISAIPNGAALVWNGAAWSPAGEGGTTVAVTGISDGPGSMTDHAGMVITVNSVESAWQYTPFALNSLIDVMATEGTPIDGHVLAWNQGAQKWEPVAHATNALANMTDVNIPVETVAIDGFALVWVNSANAWEPVSIAPVAKSGDYADLTGKPALAAVATSGGYADLTGKPALAAVATSGNYSDLSGLPIIPTKLTMLSDVRVTEGAGINGKALVWNQADTQWEPGTVAASMATLSDVQLSSPTQGQTLIWNAADSKWENGAVAAGSSALSTLSDVNVSEGAGIDGWVLSWKNADTKWEAKQLAAVATSGAYNDLTGRPALAAVATSGSYNDLASKPSIPGNSAFNLSGLGDVSMSTGAGTDGYIVYWNNGAGKFELKAESGGGGGGGSTTLAGDTDVTISSATDGQVLTYHAATSKWINADPTGGTGAGTATPPTIVQQKAFCSEVPYTLDAAPTPGNLLVALVSHWASGTQVSAGWSQVVNHTGANDYLAIYMRVASATDTAVLSPCNISNGSSAVIYELAGADISMPVAYSLVTDNTAAWTTLSTGAPPDTLVIGLFSTTGSATLPTITGATAGASTSAASGTGSGYPRSAAAFSSVELSPGSVNVTATYAGSEDTNGVILVIQPRGGASAIAGLVDVNVPSPTTGQVLVYNSVSSKWENKSAANLPVHTVSGASGVVNIDLANGETQIVNITGNITGFAITNWGAAGTLSKMTLILENTGAYSVVLPDAKWSGGLTPTVSTGAKTDIVTFFTPDHGTTLYGNVVGQNYY